MKRLRKLFGWFLLIAATLVSCSGPQDRAAAPVSPLPAQHRLSPLPPPQLAPRFAVVPRGYLPLARARAAVTEVEDGCSANGTAAAMLTLIREASWQGRPGAVCDPLLTLAAQAKADDMAERVYAAHGSPTGVGPNDNVRAVGYPLPDGYARGPDANNVESFAAGWGWFAPEMVIAAWATSPLHWRHLAALDNFFVGQTCLAVGYAYTPGRGFQHYWIFLSAPCP